MRARAALRSVCPLSSTVCHCWSAIARRFASALFWLERHDHRQQAIRALLDAESDPAAEPGDVDVDERHRTAKAVIRSATRSSMLRAPLLGLPDERQVRLGREVGDAFSVEAGACVAPVAVCCISAATFDCASSAASARRAAASQGRSSPSAQRRTSRRVRSPEPGRSFARCSPPHLVFADSSSAFRSSSSRAAVMRFLALWEANPAE